MEQDAELKAMSDIIAALEGLPDDACERVIRYAAERKGVTLRWRPTPDREMEPSDGDVADSDVSDHTDAIGFPTFAELYYSANPLTGGERALVTGYWLQFIKNSGDFSGAAVNKELQNVGDALTNVTDAFNQLMAKKPKLAIQTRKSGKSRQARKLYKLTEPGRRAVEAMLKKAE